MWVYLKTAEYVLKDGITMSATTVRVSNGPKRPRGKKIGLIFKNPGCVQFSACLKSNYIFNGGKRSGKKTKMCKIEFSRM